VQVKLFMVSEQVKLFIVSEVRLHREGLASQLAGFPNLRVTGTGTLGEALRALRASPPDIVLLDTLQPDLPIVVGHLRQAVRWLRIVAMGIREVESEVLASAAAGINGYICLDAAIDDVATVIDSVMRDELVVSPKVAASLFHSVASLSVDGVDNGASLTSRELQVIELMSHGLSNKEISSRLRIETCTAKNHVQSILQKLCVHRRGQAVAKLRSSIGHHFSPSSN